MPGLRHRTSHTIHFFFYYYGHHRALHSFPTRRSSDLADQFVLITFTEKAADELRERMEQALDRRVAEAPDPATRRSEEHTSELQSHVSLVCRLLLETKKNDRKTVAPHPRSATLNSISQ